MVHVMIPAHLNRQQSIKVDAKVPFKLEPALYIENVGYDEYNSILHGWFMKRVGNAVLSNTSSKANADLHEDRSVEFLKEVEVTTSKVFFPKFKLKFRSILDGKVLDHAFMTKWSNIEKAFYQALGHNSSVKRLSTFFEHGPSSFNGKPMEQIINDIDIHVDKTFGKTSATFLDDKNRVQSPLTWRTSMKYAIIFQITCNLPVEFKQMRTYLVQSSSALIELPKTAVRDWIDLLTIEFTGKGILHDFTTSCIPATKKKLNVNGAEIKDKATNDEALNKQWKEFPKQNAADKKLNKSDDSRDPPY